MQRTRTGDPRHTQIGLLLGLLCLGRLGLDFDLVPAVVAAILATALALQLLLDALLAGRRPDPRSALISALSLCVLLRTAAPEIGAAAAALAIGSKFLLRWRGRHLFNPTAFALVVLLLTSDRAWVSPGQWGSATLLAFAVACLGALVIHRARRSDVTLAFLAGHVGLLLARALWLGDPAVIPLHQLQSGALLLFAFFMISDPKTTPDSRSGRLCFAAGVALLAFLGRFVLYEPNALLFALVLCGFAVPLLDRVLPGARYAWPNGPASTGDLHGNEIASDRGALPAAAGPAGLLGR